MDEKQSDEALDEQVLFEMWVKYFDLAFPASVGLGGSAATTTTRAAQAADCAVQKVLEMRRSSGKRS